MSCIDTQKWRYFVGEEEADTSLGVERCLIVCYALESIPDNPRCEWIIPGTWQLT